MKTTISKLLFVCFYLTSFSLFSQRYIGYTADNYSGVHGVIYNPSSVVDSRLRSDINIFSVSSFAGSDYFAIDLNSILKAEDGFNIDDDVVKSPLNDNKFFVNLDVLGPSAMFNLNARSSLAITTRVRTFFNLNNINGTLYESLTNNFDEEDDFDFEIKDLTGTMHVWGEIGLTYGRILVDGGSNFLKGGLSLKYLQGAGTLFTNAPSVSGQFDATNETLTTTGSLMYGTSEGFDNQDIEFSNLSSGIGADLGFTYEYRPNISPDSLSRAKNKYNFKLGISITDIGSISYEGSTVNRYNLDQTLDTNKFRETNGEEDDLETILKENYEGTEEIVESKINLPTALHLLADYRFRNNFYISLQGSLSLVSEEEQQASRLLNTLTATPRLETRWFSFYLPLSIRQYDGFAMGAGFRLGPLMVGSGSAITNLISDSSRTTDVYVGLKFPFYQK
ncbi:DUF5723 family protein [Antarcticibacterium sp. 1MA-6-2]|uniref:DUF5723 family protein n=1 Tax=Antarcticibacterium sp. 1MA-6-2 TaxID=2908210 RepID=UPI001F28EE7E|nr:DUF5723 family protein [Antarcticibacterium sp. 1MA-6-2]UJH92065.1 DUF5723 family protein [Antarcticibacterium sp. 1MA-6-2]